MTITNLSTSFQVSFAGVPLLLDTATVIRTPPPEIPYGQVDRQTPVRKQQPEIDLIDEINRLLDMGYLQDFHVPHLFQNRNLTAIARPSNIGPQPNPQTKIGDFYYPNGASRWAVYRGLATSTMVKAILNTVGTTYVEGVGLVPTWNPAPFIIQQIPINPENVDPVLYTIATDLYMLPPRPLAEFGGGLDGLFLLTLVDERFYNNYLPVFIHPTFDITWDQVISFLAQALGIIINYSPISASYGRPSQDSQLWFNEESASAILDAVAANLGRVVVRNYDATYSLLTYEESQDLVVLNRGQPAEDVVRFAGGDIFNSGNQLLPAGDLRLSKNAVVPANLQVTFPRYVIGNDPVPHYLNSRYQNPRPTSWYEDSYGSTYSVVIPVTSGGSLMKGVNGVPGYQHVIHNTAKALYATETLAANIFSVPLNASGGFVSGGWNPPELALMIASPDGVTEGFDEFGELLGVYPEDVYTSGITSLATLASRIATDYYYGQTLEALDESYPGIYAWTPEGFHDIIWRYSARSRQATTRVMKRQWNTVVREMQHGTPLTLTQYQEGEGFVSTQIASVPGCGGKSVAQSWRDSFNYISGSVSTRLSQTFLSGSPFIALNDISFLPTQNRWKAVVNSGLEDVEIMLLEGTSGGLDFAINVGVALQGLDGTFPNSHVNGSVIQPIPELEQATYGVNLVTFDKNQFIYPQEMQSGGIAGIKITPQMQSVYNQSSSGLLISGENYFPGNVYSYSTSQLNYNYVEGIGLVSTPFWQKESIWLVGVNNDYLTSGVYYQGMLAGYSINISGNTAPVYLVYTPEQTVIALINSSTPNSDGLYDATVQWYDANTGTWNGGQDIWIRDANM